MIWRNAYRFTAPRALVLIQLKHFQGLKLRTVREIANKIWRLGDWLGVTSFSLFFALVAAAVFHPSPASAQSYCGPLLKVNFNGINGNGQYPTGYLAIDARGNLHGTTNSGLIWKYSPSTGFSSR